MQKNTKSHKIYRILSKKARKKIAIYAKFVATICNFSIAKRQPHDSGRAINIVQLVGDVTARARP